MSSERDYISLPVRDFLADLAAKSPTPGGGSAAAMVGAIAVAQAQMVVGYSLGKSASSQHEARLKELIEEFDRAGAMFAQLVREDMAAYERCSALGKDSRPEKRERALATAITVPMEIVALAGAVLARLDEIKTYVNPRLFSDLKVAAVLACAAAQACCPSVEVNLANLADRPEAERVQGRLDMMIERSVQHQDGVVHYQAY